MIQEIAEGEISLSKFFLIETKTSGLFTLAAQVVAQGSHLGKGTCPFYPDWHCSGVRGVQVGH